MNQVDYPTFQSRYNQNLPTQDPTIGQEQPGAGDLLTPPAASNPWSMMQASPDAAPAAPAAAPVMAAPSWNYEGK